MDKYNVTIEYEGTNSVLETKVFYVVAPHLDYKSALEIVAAALNNTHHIIKAITVTQGRDVLD